MRKNFLAIFIVVFLFSASSFAISLEEKLLHESSQEAALIFENFQKKAAYYVILCEYVSPDCLSHKQRKELLNAVSTFSMKISNVLLSQRALKKRVANYPGSDWDQLFGQTGFWRNLDALIINTSILKLQIEYPKIITASRQLKQKLILAQIKELDVLESQSRCASLTAHRAKLFRCLAFYNFRFREKSLALNLQLAQESSPESLTNIISSLELMALESKASPKPAQLYLQLQKTSYSDSILLNLRLAISAYLSGEEDSLAEKILSAHPKVAPLFCETLLKAYEKKAWRYLLKIRAGNFSPFTADCISYALLNAGDSQNSLAENIVSLRKNSLTLYVHSHGVMQANGDVSKCLDLLIQASKSDCPRDWLGDDFSETNLSYIAAQYAFDKLRECKTLGGQALVALEKYRLSAGSEIDEELEYSLSSLLLDSEPLEAKRILQEIINRGSKFSGSARFDIAVHQLQLSSDSVSIEAINQLQALIDEASDKASYSQGLLLYGEVILDNEMVSEYPLLLAYFDDSRLIYTPEFATLHAQILLRSDRAEEAVIRYYSYAKNNKEFDSELAGYLAWTVVRKYEYFAENAKDVNLLFDCVEDFLRRSLKISPQNCGLAHLLAEFELLKYNKLGESISCDNNAVDVLRVTARNSQKLGEFEKASQLWLDLSMALKSKGLPQSKQSWQWWRAKYYQLYSYSLARDIDWAELKHAISVLVATEPAEKNMWYEKTLQLKKRLADD